MLDAFSHSIANCIADSEPKFLNRLYNSCFCIIRLIIACTATTCMYAQKLDLKDTEGWIRWRQGYMWNKQIPIRNSIGYKGIVEATCMRIWTDKQLLVRLWPCDSGSWLYKNASGEAKSPCTIFNVVHKSKCSLLCCSAGSVNSCNKSSELVSQCFAHISAHTRGNWFLQFRRCFRLDLHTQDGGRLVRHIHVQ